MASSILDPPPTSPRSAAHVETITPFTLAANHGLSSQTLATFTTDLQTRENAAITRRRGVQTQVPHVPHVSPCSVNPCLSLTPHRSCTKHTNPKEILIKGTSQHHKVHEYRHDDVNTVTFFFIQQYLRLLAKGTRLNRPLVFLYKTNGKAQNENKNG